jgi:hypothetical protein
LRALAWFRVEKSAHEDANFEELTDIAIMFCSIIHNTDSALLQLATRPTFAEMASTIEGALEEVIAKDKSRDALPSRCQVVRDAILAACEGLVDAEDEALENPIVQILSALNV